MKRKYIYNNKAHKIEKRKRVIFFVSVIIFGIIFGAIVSKFFLATTQDVKANETINVTLAVKGSEPDNKSGHYLSLKDDPVADDIAFLEKYLNQQIQGITPDGADGKKVAYLTFDDGPSEKVTASILDVLKEENVKATFFVMGRAFDKSDTLKDVLKREVKEGHAIGNHTYSHNYKYLFPSRTVNADNFMLDIEKNNKLLKEVLGEDFSTRSIRVPGGHMSWTGMKPLDDILASKDYHYVDWNALSKDAEGKNKNSEELTKQVIDTVNGKEKAVILMHDSSDKEQMVIALPQIIQYLREQGYEFRTMK